MDPEDLIGLIPPGASEGRSAQAGRGSSGPGGRGRPGPPVAPEVDPAGLAFEELFGLGPTALRSLASLMNLERGQQQGVGENLAEAGQRWADYAQDPMSNTYRDYAEDVNFPYPGAAGLAMEVLEPGPGEGRALVDPILGMMPFLRGLRKTPNVASIVESASQSGRVGYQPFDESMRTLQQAFGDDPDLGTSIVSRGGGFEVSDPRYTLQFRYDPTSDGIYIDTLRNRGDSARPSPALSAVFDLLDSHGITARTMPDAFGDRRMTTPQLRMMYNRMGFAPEPETGLAGTYARQPLPIDEAARKAELRGRMDEFDEAIAGLPQYAKGKDAPVPRAGLSEGALERIGDDFPDVRRMWLRERWPNFAQFDDAVQTELAPRFTDQVPVEEFRDEVDAFLEMVDRGEINPEQGAEMARKALTDLYVDGLVRGTTTVDGQSISGTEAARFLDGIFVPGAVRD